MKAIFTDLDGTLLHERTYSFEPAVKALARLRRDRIPVVLSTSKTRAEVELWRQRLDNADPFIVENGGAVFIPHGYFPFDIPDAERRGAYDMVAFGTPYAILVEALRSASRQTGCQVLGFNDMSVAEVAIRSLLPVHQAQLAKEREFDEPFEILGQCASNLLRAIDERGLHWTRGDRFYHITGPNDKAKAVAFLAGLYQEAFGPMETVGIGDGPNDAPFLQVVDSPVIVRSRFVTPLRLAVPHAFITAATGPHGWSEGIEMVLGGGHAVAAAGV